MISSDRMSNTRNKVMDLSKASYHGKNDKRIVDGPKNQAVDAVAKPLSSFEQNGGPLPLPLHRKRSKPRRQSGPLAANITEDNFKSNRPVLLRDDSLVLLKHQTTNAIAMIVPLVTNSNDAPEERPLSRIHRRKPRRMSGDAVAEETRPVIVRGDSLMLTKKKLAGIVPLTYEVEDIPREPVSPKKTDDNSTEDSTKPASPKASDSPSTRRQKQKGYVRQNSLSPPCA